jgi:hypothetical protein
MPLTRAAGWARRRRYARFDLLLCLSVGSDQQGGHPDLRNFDAWCQEVLTGDIVLVVSDGIEGSVGFLASI